MTAETVFLTLLLMLGIVLIGAGAASWLTAFFRAAAECWASDLF